MTHTTPQADADKLIAVTDVSGAEPALRAEVARTGVEAGEATSALRNAIRELHKSDDAAWRRYAIDLDDATRRFDTSLGLAAARLRAEQAASKVEIKNAIDEVAGSWRSLADEIRVQAHIGTMDAKDRGAETVSDLERASHRMGALLLRLRDEVGESIGHMRDEAKEALDDAARILHGH